MERPQTQRVKRLLSQLADNTNWSSDKSAIIAELLSIFEQFPSLCRSKYLGKKEATPLHCFLEAGIKDIATIQRLCCSLCEKDLVELVEFPNGKGDLPIHLACRYSTGDIIEYLGGIKPELLRRKDSQGNFPFVYAIMGNRAGTTTSTNTRKRVPCRTLEKLLHWYPEAGASSQLFSKALNERYPVRLLETMAAAFPKNGQTLRIQVLPSSRPALDQEETQVICNLLSKHTTLDLRVPWEFFSFTFMLSQLMQNRSITRVNYLSTPLVPQVQMPFFSATLQHLLKYNRTIRDLCIVFWYNECLNRSCFQAIKQGLSSNDALEKLEMLTFRRWNFVFTKTPSTGLFPNMDRQLSVSFRKRADVSAHSRMLLEVPNYFNLTSLYLSGTEGLGLDELSGSLATGIVTLVKTAQNLQKLTFFRYKLKMVPILEALKERSCIQSFNAFSSKVEDTNDAVACCLSMLKERNVTLKECAPLHRVDPMVDFYLQLNRCGRGMARQCGRVTLVNLLAACWTDTCRIQFSQRYQAAKLSVVYALLKECPSKWCFAKGQSTPQSRATRKRKLDSMDPLGRIVKFACAPSTIKSPTSKLTSSEDEVSKKQDEIQSQLSSVRRLSSLRCVVRR